MDELIDIYDRNRVRTGTVIPRSEAHLGEGEYMLYVLALIEDAQGRMLITRRALDKRWAAGWWEVPGGGARAGEDSLAALLREVREETGLDAAQGDPKLVYSYENVDLPSGDNYFVDIYLLHLDIVADDIVLQHEEAIDARLASWDEIDELAEQGVFLHYRRLRLAREALGA
jgi:8-oxo-dGTP pyrophosphatase MutT (NUDIX family)